MARFFSNLASRCSYWMGQPSAFLLSTLACILWAVSGPLFNYSDTWQLVINTATTVLTFLAVFLIQNTQNRDGVAVQAKLDEILIAVSKARTELVGIENLTDAEVNDLKAAIEREALDPKFNLTDEVSPASTTLPVQNYFDVATVVRDRKGFELRLGVNNLLDRQPPLVVSNTAAGDGPFNANTYPEWYDPLGRFSFASLSVKLEP